MTNIYHATPYDISATGFYFSSFEEYQKKAKNHRNEYGDLVEEYEMQFIDGDNCTLFSALGVNQANLQQWFSEFENLPEEKAVKALYLIEDCGYEISDFMTDRLDEVYLFEGTAREYVEDYIENTGMLEAMPENLQPYFDYDAFTRDMLLNGEIYRMELNGKTYIVETQ